MMLRRPFPDDANRSRLPSPAFILNPRQAPESREDSTRWPYDPRQSNHTVGHYSPAGPHVRPPRYLPANASSIAAAYPYQFASPSRPALSHYVQSNSRQKRSESFGQPFNASDRGSIPYEAWRTTSSHNQQRRSIITSPQSHLGHRDMRGRDAMSMTMVAPYRHSSVLDTFGQANIAESHRKRLRNSRSCAECQRRKTRCDVVGAFSQSLGHESPRSAQNSEDEMTIVQPCTKCVRGGLECHYSRRSLKKPLLREGGKDHDSTTHSVTDNEDSVVAAVSSEQSRNLSGLELGLSAGTQGEQRPCRPWEEMSSQSDRPPDKRSSVARETGLVLASLHHSTEVHSRCHEMRTPPHRRSNPSSSPVARGSVRLSPKEEDVQEVANGTFDIAQFYASSANATFGLCARKPKDEPIFDGRADRHLLLEAMDLLLMPVPAVEAAGESSRSANLRVVHRRRLQSHALTPIRNSTTTASLHAGFMASLNAIGLARKHHAKFANVQADVLALCYLDSLRMGEADASSLAAAISKSCQALRGQRSSRVVLQRIRALYSMDRWHTFAFGTPCIMPEELLSGRVDQPEDLQLFPNHQEQNNTPRLSAEVLRTALTLNDLFKAARNVHSWAGISVDDCEKFIERHSWFVRREKASLRRAESLEALGCALDGCVRLFHRLHTAPASRSLTIHGLMVIEESLEDFLFGDGSSESPPDQGVLLESFVGPHIFALAACSLMWLSRATACLAKKPFMIPTQERRSAELAELERLRNRLQDLAHEIDALCSSAALEDKVGRASTSHHQDGAPIRPLYLRIVAFTRATASDLSTLGDIGPSLSSPMSSPSTPDQSRQLHAGELDIARDLDGRAELINDAGPLGVILLSTTDTDVADCM